MRREHTTAAVPAISYEYLYRDLRAHADRVEVPFTHTHPEVSCRMAPQNRRVRRGSTQSTYRGPIKKPKLDDLDGRRWSISTLNTSGHTVIHLVGRSIVGLSFVNEMIQ